MNDRLTDLGFGDDGAVPSWAMDGGGGGGGGGGESTAASPSPSSNGKENKTQGGNNWANDGGGGDIELADAGGGGGGGEQSQPQFMITFFKDVEDIKGGIEAVRAATRRVGEINEEAVLATTSAKEDELSRQLKPLIDATNKRAKRTKNLLALLKADNVKLKEEGSAKEGDMRIRENLSNTLTRKFIDEMKSYQNAQQKYKSDIKKKVKRQVQIVQPDVTDEDVDQIMKSGGGREAIYQQKILAGRVNDSITNTYAKAAGKYQDVLTLEASVAELHQMFLDFALLTEQQGELLDQIEFQVRSAGDYIEEANEQVVEAIEIQKKVRKKQCIIIAIVIVVGIVILFPVLNSFI